MDTKIKLLVVDDEKIVLDSITKILRHEEDLVISTAKSVSESLQIISSELQDIVLTDLMMPEVDGLEFLKLIKGSNYNTIVILITGYATINTALQAMQLGAFDYLAKPFTKEELKRIIRRAADLISVAKTTEQEGKIRDITDTDNVRISAPLKGTGKHSWMVHEEDGTVLIGVERPFLYTVGKIQNIYLPLKGDVLHQGSTFLQIFSTDLRSLTLLSPLSGEVDEVNSDVLNDPNKAMQDPYGTGWLIRLKPTNFEEEIKLMGL